MSRYESKVNYEAFSELRDILNNNPINEETQKYIEDILPSIYHKSGPDQQKEGINYEIFGVQFNLFIVEVENELDEEINNTRNRVYTKKPRTSNKVNLYYVNKMLQDIDNKDIKPIILGKLLIIANINNKFTGSLESRLHMELASDMI